MGDKYQIQGANGDCRKNKNEKILKDEIEMWGKCTQKDINSTRVVTEYKVK